MSKEPGARPIAEISANGDIKASDGTGFHAQRETLQLKAQLNAKSRQILALMDDLEARERDILGAKRTIRELQAQASDFETNQLATQEQMLSAREAAAIAQREMQTALKREEALKSRLDATQETLKEVEQQGTAALTDTRQTIQAHQTRIAELEAEREELGCRLAAASQTIAGLQHELASTREEAAGLAAGLRQLHDIARALVQPPRSSSGAAGA
jgi:chromosome segregation ATPase